MKRVPKIALALTAGLSAVAGAYAAPPAENAPRSIWDGAYTEAQARRGKIKYESKCASCHGSALTGMDVAPALAGDRFIGNWSGQTAGELAVRIRTTMPSDDPGSLGSGETADMIAYMFMMNRLPAGTTELPANAAQLRQIRIEARK